MVPIPLPTLILDESGNLYDTTSEGGAYSSGTVLKLTQTRVEVGRRVSSIASAASPTAPMN